MFTGLVEAVGTVAALVPVGDGVRLEVAVPATLAGTTDRPGCRLGDSVAIDGCCLTVIADDGTDRWAFEAGAETLSKTTLGRRRPGDAVNLERALPADGRFGGHIVQGHVDGTATVAAIARHGNWIDLRFTLAAELAALLVPKGSVAVDGVSLTVVEAAADGFSVALIPHTLEATTLGRRAVGDRVNLETDILGKYVARLLSAR